MWTKLWCSVKVSHTSKIQIAVSWIQSQGHKKLNRCSLLIFWRFFKYKKVKEKKKRADDGFQRETITTSKKIHHVIISLRVNYCYLCETNRIPTSHWGTCLIPAWNTCPSEKLDTSGSARLKIPPKYWSISSKRTGGKKQTKPKN